MSELKHPNTLMNPPTRRQLIGGVAVAFGGLALGSTEGWSGIADEIFRQEESIHQEPVFKASRKRVYEALTDAKQFSKVTELSGAMKSGGRRVLALRRPYPGTTYRTCAERANRPSLASG